MSLRETRHKQWLQAWLAHKDAERAVDEIEAVISTRAQKVVSIWNARAEPLFYPTFKTALRAGYRWLTYMCPACRQVGETDLTEWDYHPDASISALIPKLSCSRCCSNPPHAQLVQLHRWPVVGQIERSKPIRRKR
jgi:5-formyltetrahydrofolate cyclo-ligase